MGHTKCGALKGALDATEIEKLGMDNLNHLLYHFNPSIPQVLEVNEEKSSNNENLLNRLNVRNIEQTLEDIRNKSSTLRNLEKEGKILIVGANYDVETGAVTWI